MRSACGFCAARCGRLWLCLGRHGLGAVAGAGLGRRCLGRRACGCGPWQAAMGRFAHRSAAGAFCAAFLLHASCSALAWRRHLACGGGWLVQHQAKAGVADSGGADKRIRASHRAEMKRAGRAASCGCAGAGQVCVPIRSSLHSFIPSSPHPLIPSSPHPLVPSSSRPLVLSSSRPLVHSPLRPFAPSLLRSSARWGAGAAWRGLAGVFLCGGLSGVAS